MDCQLRTNKVTDLRVQYAFETVPREDFVPEARRSIAYVDEDLEIAPGRKARDRLQQYISRPSRILIGFGTLH